MRKLTRFLACFLAALLVLSNLQYATINVKAAEGDEIIQDDGEEGGEDVGDGTGEEGGNGEEPGTGEEGGEGEEPGTGEEGGEGEEPGTGEEGGEGEEPGTGEEGGEGEEPGTGGEGGEGEEPGTGGEGGEGEEPGTGEEGDDNEEDTADVDSITYTFANIQYDSKGPEVKVNEDGSATIKATGNYSSVFLTIPEEVAEREIQKITFNVTSENAGNFAYKVFLAEGFADAMWGSGITVTDESPYAIYGNPVQEIPADYQTGLGYMAVMSSFAEGSGIEEDTIEISDITFDCTPIKPVEKTYSFAELTCDSKGPEVKVNEDGSASIKATGNYASVFITIPEEVAAGEIQKITFNVTSENAGNFAYKVFLAEGFADAMWGNGITVTDESPYAIYGNPVQVIPEDYQAGLGYMAVMSSFAEGSGIEEDTIEISGITFTYLKNSNKPQITYGDNIILNPNFAEEDLTVWNAENSKTATISKGEAEKAIFDDVTTYGIIDRNADSSTGDAFVQDITDAVTIGKEYKVEFYAMLSDDYADAPADQRVVEFAPYLMTEQGETKYLGATYSSQLSGKLSQTLTPGEWTKYSGTFRVTDSGTINKVVIRILEQGTNYGAGDCVKGDYYVTGVSMTEIIKPPIKVQDTGDLRWKDAITNAFGEDAIAGTCLGSGTITYEYLQEITKKHFNAITFENEMKPDITLGSSPKFDEEGNLVYNFNVADSMLATIKAWNDANEADIRIRGHVLVWHSQTPEWFFHENYNVEEDFVTPEEMDERLEHYIKSVFEHYDSVVYADGSTATDLFYGWDIVNEAISDTYSKPRKAEESSNWARVYGDQSNEYIINAFKYANMYADKDIKLYYNDYNDSNPAKAAGIAQLIKDIKAVEGTRIDGMGMQAHHNYADPSSNQIKNAINMYLEALGEGGSVQMTELDVKASSTYDPNNLVAEHNKQAWRFKEIFDAYKAINNEKPGSVTGITVWGVTDNHSWLQSSNSVGGASQGGTHAPLLFAVDEKEYIAYAKPAFYAFFEGFKDEEGNDIIDGLEPFINNITVIQQLEKDNFAKGTVYNVGDVAQFIPMWTEEDGLVVKFIVADNTINDADSIAVYVDEADEIVKTTVLRSDEAVKETETGYEVIMKLPVKGASAKTFKMDVAINNDDEVTVFNDKKNTYEESSKYYADVLMKPYAVLQFGSVEVDGVYDEEWDGVSAIPLTIKLGAKADASVKALWDDEFLYIYADVKDDVLDMSSSQVHEKDSIEVFIDENNAKADGYEDDDKQYRINYANEQSYNGTKCLPENVISATRLTDTGYIVEAAFKWTDITPESGMEIGIEFQLNDGEGGTRLGTASWFDASGNGWQSAAVFGNALLNADGRYIKKIKNVVYTGEEISPKVAIYEDGKALTEGKDYTVAYKDNLNAGVATATVTYIGDYEEDDEVVLTYQILPKSLADEDIISSDLEVLVKRNDTFAMPEIVVKYGDKVLVKDTDYILDIPDIPEKREAVTNYEITIKPANDNFVDSKVITLTIIEEFGAFNIAAQVYTGKAITPEVNVCFKGVNLENKKDYTVKYANNVNVGTATATITGKGNYVGVNEIVTFEILPKDLADEDIVVKDLFVKAKVDGSVVNPAISVKFGKTTLKEKTHYTVDWSRVGLDEKGNPIPGDYVVYIDAVERTNYTGTKEVAYKIVANNDVDMSKVSVKLKGKVDYDAFYAGDVSAIEVTVAYKGDSLLKEDAVKAKLEWPEEVTVGKNNVLTIVAIDGQGFYGQKTVKFEVTGTKFSTSTMIIEGVEAATYTGNAIELNSLIVKDKALAEDANVLEKGVDYEVSYAKNVNVGTATATIKGLGRYVGTIKKTFKINAMEVKNPSVSLANQTYTGKKLTPAPVIVVKGITLTNKDYTVKYSNNTNAGKATVKVSFKGNYKGTWEGGFTIAKKSLSDEDVTTNTTINATINKNGTSITNPKIAVKLGKTTLKANRDYTVVWPEFAKDENGKIKADTYEVIVKAVDDEKCNFTGDFSIDYDVLAYGTVQMSKVKVSVKKMAYLDYEQDNTKLEVTVKNGKTTLTAEQYVIDYPDEIAVGKNNVITVVSADPKYYGSKTAKFELTGIKLSTKATEFEISGIDAQYEYTGEEIKPVVTIKDVKRDCVLIEGTDYTVEYTNCKNAGKKATVVIKGLGAYTGKITKKFEITKFDMSSK